MSAGTPSLVIIGAFVAGETDIINYLYGMLPA